MTEDRKRTSRQNRAVHKFFEEASNELNNSGISQKLLIQNLDVEHTPQSVKSIFRAIGKAKFEKTSTADLTTKELQDCFEEITRLFAQHGIDMKFPSYEDSEEYLKSYEL